MGFFNKKKNTDTPASVLSESEIQKKLYGEFNLEEAHHATREREHFKESSAQERAREAAHQREASRDFFAVPKESSHDAGLPPHEDFPQQKPANHAPRYVPLQDFERKPVSSNISSPGVDPYSRFRSNRSQGSRRAMLWDLIRGFLRKSEEFFRVFSDPQQRALRSFFYWGGGILVVVLLFLGVNALNLRREEAMRTRYKLRGEAAPMEVPTRVPEKGTAFSTPVVEHEVRIAPAPVRLKKLSTAEGSATSTAQAGGAFVIQVVTYPTRQGADQVVETLRRGGSRAFVKEDIRPTGRVFYLVLLGGFRTEAEAQAQLLKFRATEVARPFQDAFIKSSRT